MEGKQTAPVLFVSAVLCAILCAIFPFAGFVTVIVLPAVFGVFLAASFSLPVALSPLPGIVIAGLLWRSPSVSVCGLVLLIPAAVLCVCLRKKSSASVITLAAAVSYAAVFASALIAYALYNYGSLSAAADALVSFMSSYVDKLFAAATDAAADTAAGDALSSLTEQISADAYVRNLTMLMPGAFLAACEVLGYLLSHAARLAIRILPVPIGLYPDKRNISLPASAAVLFLLSFAVTMFSRGRRRLFRRGKPEYGADAGAVCRRTRRVRRHAPLRKDGEKGCVHHLFMHTVLRLSGGRRVLGLRRGSDFDNCRIFPQKAERID